jgi:uncharacterized repeat protein (TIGR01451 family)
VGAIDDEKAPAAFSSRGPNAWDEIKPEIAAPGVQVRSAFPGGGYATANGTSMATPHVAGVAALLLQANPNLTPDELESMLKETAQPLGGQVPNNDTGWGLVNAYAAGLRVTHHGELRGQVTRADGAGVAQPAITAALRDGSPGMTVLGDASGAFTVALRPGSYDVTADAFGFAPAAEFSLPIVTGTSTSVQFQLTLLPHGSLFGRVTDSQTGAPLSATIVAEGTPAQAQTDRNTGMYSLALPEGTWPLNVTAPAHRINHITATVTAGSGLVTDVALPPAPRILLVDSGPWYYESQARYYQDALDALNYPYTLWPIRDLAEGASDLPTKKVLTSYDVVIWSAPQDSPGMIGADAAITPALSLGVRFLVSGEDVAFWDGGGWPYALPASYFWDDMALRFASEGNLADLSGAPATPLAGITLTLNTPDSAGQQNLPDSATIADPVLTEPALTWPDGSIGGAVAGVCRPYRAAWLGFGLEGVGPRPARIATLGRLLDWLTAAPSPHGLAVSAAAVPLIGAPGEAVSQTIHLTNAGVATDTFALDLAAGAWPFDLALPDGRHVSASTSFTLAGCSSVTLTATIAIPPDIPRNQRTTYTLRLANQADPAFAATVTLTAKTPAPLLLVDDERFYNYQDRFTRTLEAMGVVYDIFDTQGGDRTPGANVLERYPLAVWTTGYDWYSPLTEEDEANLSAYLDQGGRLLLSSQDLLDVRKLSDFVRTRLGVADATLAVTPTQVVALPGGLLGSDLGPWRLHFRFLNWGDGITPAPGASGILQDEHQNTVGLVNPAPAWRTAFFAFPLETLDDAPRRRVLSRALLWLSTLGESSLTAPPVAAAGSRIPLTLTLRLATDQAQSGLRAVVPLPAEAALAPDSLRGPWSYDPVARSLAWAGALLPGVTVTLGADLDLAIGITEGRELPLLAQLYLGDGMTVTADAPVLVGGPWLTLTKGVTPAEAGRGETVQFTLTTTNAGFVSTTAILTDVLPGGLTLLPGTAQAERGDVIEAGWGITWTGALEPGAMTTITFGAVVTPSRAGIALINQAEVVDQNQRWRLARAAVQVPARVYLPVLWK